jgi:broad specificity phosphatase PhoE
MKTTLYFVRHGQVYNPRNIVYARLPRFRLSDVGREQAAVAARILKDSQPSDIFSSPMLRTRQTAEIIAREHPALRVKINRLINENFTPFQGQSFDVVAARNGDIFTGVQPPYELPADHLKRSLEFIRKMRRTYDGKSIIAVTHGDIVRVIIRWALGYPPENDGNPVPFPGTGSVTALVFDNPEQELPALEYLS